MVSMVIFVRTPALRTPLDTGGVGGGLISATGGDDGLVVVLLVIVTIVAVDPDEIAEVVGRSDGCFVSERRFILSVLVPVGID